MSSQTILREYLLSLGFKVDTTGQRKFDSAIASTNKGALVAGLSISGLAAGIVAMAEQYAKAMEKMYYASRRSGTTVSTLQGMEFAGEKIGMAAGAMTAGVNTFAAKLRMNPGLTGLLNKMGVRTGTGDSGKEMLDMIQKTLAMSYVKGASVAQLFGMDEQTYQQIRQNFDEYKAAMEEREKMDKAGKVNADANAKAIAEWDKNVTTLKASFTMLEGALQSKLLPLMERITAETQKTAVGLQQDLQEAQGFWDFIFKRGDRAAKEGTAAGLPWDPNGPAMGINGGGMPWTGEGTSADLSKPFNKFRRWAVGLGHENDPGYVDRRLGSDTAAIGGGAGRGSVNPTMASGGDDKAAFLANLEKKYGLPSGMLDSIWQQESKRGTDPRAFNGKGAGSSIGDFQITRSTGNKYGGWSGEFSTQADQAAQIMKDNYGRLHDWTKAATSFNAGDDVARHPETGTASQRAYGDSVMGRVNQTVTINVNGVSGGDIVGKTKQALGQANGDLVRQVKTVVQ